MEQIALVDLPSRPTRLLGYRSALEVVGVLRRAGHAAYLVGGGVRDLVLGVAPKDFDIVTSARPEETQALFPRSISVGAQFGVVTVVHKNRSFEVATFRAEGGYTDGRRPGWVSFADLEADLARRDFTINGLVLDPDEECILDWYGGLEDMRRGIIRTIGDPAERFEEDALRIVRAVRFGARLGYRLEPATRRALVAAALTITRVAKERIWQELDLMMRHATRSAALALLNDTGLLQHIVPNSGALTLGGGGLWSRTVRRVAALAPQAPAESVWASVLADVICPKEPARNDWDDDGPLDRNAARQVQAILAALRAPRRLSRTVGELLSRRWAWCWSHRVRRGSLARLLRRDTHGALLALWKADAASFGRSEAAEPLEQIALSLRENGQMLKGSNQPPVTGDDLLARGLRPGPRIQERLAESERLWLENRMGTAQDVSAWLSRMAKEHAQRA